MYGFKTKKDIIYLNGGILPGEEPKNENDPEYQEPKFEVDQHWTPASINAQSGTAVREAINESEKKLSQQIATATDKIFRYKGSVANEKSLPNNGKNVVGDVYNVNDTDANYAWDGTKWDKLSQSFAGLATTTDLNNLKSTVEGIQAVTGELKIDQSYNANSQYAASGKAVAAAVNAHANNNTIHLTSAEKTKVGLLVNPLLFTSGTLINSVVIGGNSKANTIADGYTSFTAAQILGNTSNLELQCTSKRHFINGVSIHGYQSNIFARDTNQVVNSDANASVRLVDQDGVVIGGNSTYVGSLNNSNASTSRLTNFGTTVLGWSSTFRVQNNNGVFISGGATTINTVANNGVAVFGYPFNGTGRFTTTDSFDHTNHNGITIHGSNGSNIPSRIIVSKNTNLPTVVHGILNFDTGGTLKANGTALITNGTRNVALTSELTTHTNNANLHVDAATKTKLAKLVQSTVGKVTDVQFYAASNAPTLSARKTGVLYLIGQ